MANVYIIAEAAQGYEGSVDAALLLVKAAASAGADAIKFQLVYADELCEPGYIYYDLFKCLELDKDEWLRVRKKAEELNVEFITDVFGPISLGIADYVNANGCKLHSTTFYDDDLTTDALKVGSRHLISVGGIEPHDIKAFIERHNVKGLEGAVLMYGFQAEPTPIESNNLSRIPNLRAETGLEIGFMDHCDGDSPYTTSLSAVALGLGVATFEKHITLDRKLEMEDFVSALGPTDFERYASELRGLANALGKNDLSLTDEEVQYRHRAIKRVVAARDLPAGHALERQDLKLSRPAEQKGLFVPADAIGKKLRATIESGTPIGEEDLT